jgi:cellulose synthase/poly-beta-1,6-N-acetylglucosamine synthase-like glycosyltransferase
MTPQPVTVLVTAYREAVTLGAALEAILAQTESLSAEVIVICPDDETAQMVQRFVGARVLRDEGRGKPAALNLGLAAAAGEIVVMTDGDVQIDTGALTALLMPFDDPATGAVSGRPVSTSPRGTMLGYWSRLLTDAGAHAERELREARGQFLVCSGYLYAIRRRLVSHIPEDALAEDAVVSHQVADQGYRVRYAPNAVVKVKYPTTYADWLKQKVRSAGGYAQPVIANSPLQMRGFWQEAWHGTQRALAYPRSARELFWTLALFLARLHLWLLIAWQVRLLRRPLSVLWQRVESTK